MISTTHKFVSPKTEQSDPSLVGPNEWNAVHSVIDTSTILVSCDYNFTPQAPGTNLAVGSNSIVLNPLPTGLVVNNYLYISGGTGTAESVQITGTSGNTIIVTCANTHTGAWTIQSATSGLQEAVVALPASGGKIIQSCNVTLNANVVSLGKAVLIEKFPGYTVNFGAYTILGNNAYDPAADCTWATNDIIINSASTGPTVTNYPTDASVRIIRNTLSSPSVNYLNNALWVQEDFSGSIGTPACIVARLNCPNTTNTNGVGAVEGYTVLGANATTVGFGIHGDCTTYNAASIGTAVNAEGAYLGTTGTGQLIGFVSNMNADATYTSSMIGLYAIMNANPSGALNTEGGVKITAALNSQNRYGVLVTEKDGGAFLSGVTLLSNQANANAISIYNGNTGAVATDNIIFIRGEDITTTTNTIASVVVSNNSGDYSTGILQLCVNKFGGTGPTPGLTIDSFHNVTVPFILTTTPITVSQLPTPATNAGAWACVSDSSVNTWGTVVAGGGSLRVGVFCNGTAWTVAAH